MSVLEENRLDLKLFGNLTSDGPKLKEPMQDSLLPLIVCMLHIVHTGFHHGIKMYASDVEKIAMGFYGWFKIASFKPILARLFGRCYIAVSA